MKKIIALLLALTMLLSVSAVFAEGAPSAEDLNYLTVIGEGAIEIVWTDDDGIGDDGEGLAGQAVQSQKAGSALDILPQEIRDLLPEGYTVVNEIRSMKFQGDMDKLAKLDELKVVIKFDTPYAKDEVVYLAVGIPAEETEWVLLTALGNDDQNLEVTFDRETLAKIGEKSFAVLAISKK